MSPRRYIITGAASGIGLATVELAVAAGGRVALVDVNAETLEAAVNDLKERGADVFGLVADLNHADEPERIIEQCVGFLGGIDVLVSNAGKPQFFPLESIPVEAFDEVIALNLRATLLLGKAAYPYLRESRGNIVATASITGRHPAPPQGAYGVAKAGLLHLVRQMAVEWGPEGIRCNSVSPGPTTTGLTEGVFNDPTDPVQKAIIDKREAALPLRKIGRPVEVANAIMFLASPEASQITGVDIVVDGGQSLVAMVASGVGLGR